MGRPPLSFDDQIGDLVEVFQYLPVLFNRRESLEREVDRRVSEMVSVVPAPEEGAKPKGEALELPINQRCLPHL